MPAHPYPAVRARLRRTRRLPHGADRPAELLIWLDGARFLVRDQAGRPYADLAGDVTQPRGLGTIPRTMEAMMDAWSVAHPRRPRWPLRARRPARTQVDGDWSSGRAFVQERGGTPWGVDVRAAAAVAEQLLNTDREAGLSPTGEVTYLDRRCVEYRYTAEGTEDGVPYRSVVRTLVSAPFVLLREVRDAEVPECYAVTEVVELAEGATAWPIPS